MSSRSKEFRTETGYVLARHSSNQPLMKAVAWGENRLRPSKAELRSLRNKQKSAQKHQIPQTINAIDTNIVDTNIDVDSILLDEKNLRVLQDVISTINLHDDTDPQTLARKIDYLLRKGIFVPGTDYLFRFGNSDEA